MEGLLSITYNILWLFFLFYTISQFNFYIFITLLLKIIFADFKSNAPFCFMSTFLPSQRQIYKTFSLLLLPLFSTKYPVPSIYNIRYPDSTPLNSLNKMQPLFADINVYKKRALKREPIFCLICICKNPYF